MSVQQSCLQVPHCTSRHQLPCWRLHDMHSRKAFHYQVSRESGKFNAVCKEILRQVTVYEACLSSTIWFGYCLVLIYCHSQSVIHTSPWLIYNASIYYMHYITLPEGDKETRNAMQLDAGAFIIRDQCQAIDNKLIISSCVDLTEEWKEKEMPMSLTFDCYLRWTNTSTNTSAQSDSWYNKYTYFIHSFIPAISIAPLQVLYYSEALPTTARILYRSFTPKRTGNCR